MAKKKKEKKQQKDQKKDNQSKKSKKNLKQEKSTQFNKKDEPTKNEDENKSLEDYRREFEKTKQEYQSGSSGDQNGSGGMDLDIKSLTSMLGMLSSNLVPEQYREQYIKMYVNNTTPFLKMLGLDKFVAQYSFEEIPMIYKIIIVGLVLIIPMGTGIMYFNKNAKSKKEEGDQS